MQPASVTSVTSAPPDVTPQIIPPKAPSPLDKLDWPRSSGVLRYCGAAMLVAVGTILRETLARPLAIGLVIFTLTGITVSVIAQTLNRAHQRTEEKLLGVAMYSRSLIETGLDPLMVISPGGKITDINQATEQATGVVRSGLIGTDFAGYFTEPEQARIGYRQVFERGQLTARKGDLKLCGMSRQVRGAFDLVRLHRIFDIYPSRAEAVLAFQSKPAGVA